MRRIDAHIGLRPTAQTPYDRYLERHGLLRGFSQSDEAVRWLDGNALDFGILLHGDWPVRRAATEAHPDRLGAFVPVILRRAAENWDETEAYLKEAAAAGCVGIGSIYTYRENIPLDHPVIRRIAAFACEHKLPVHIECAATIGLSSPLRTIVPPYTIEALVSEFPDLYLILSAYGGGMFLYELMPELPPHLNRVFYETASSVDGWNHPAMLRAASKIVRSERLLFGSGAPVEPLAPSRELVGQLPREVGERFLGGNLERLLLECGRSPFAQPVSRMTS